MNTSDARALLGVDPEAGPEAIRRAYLRACKKHRPETDPEGFQRVRAAYELLSHTLSTRAAAEVFVPMGHRPRDERETSEPDIEAPADLASRSTSEPSTDPPNLAPPLTAPPTSPRTRDLHAWLLWLDERLRPEALLDDTDPGELGQCALAITHGLTSSGPLGHIGHIEPPFILLALALWARGQDATARGLIKALMRVPRVAVGPAAPLWALVRELEGLREVPRMVGPIAECLLRDHDGPLVRWLSTQGSNDRYAGRAELERSAPSLTGRFLSALMTYAPLGVDDVGSGGLPPWLSAIVMLVVIGVVGALSMPRKKHLEVPAPVDERGIACLGTRDTCEPYDELHRAVQHGDCNVAIARLRTLESQDPPRPLPVTRALVVGHCGPVPRPAPASSPNTARDPEAAPQ